MSSPSLRLAATISFIAGELAPYGASGSLRRAVGDQFEREEDAEAAHVTDDAVCRRQRLESRAQHLVADALGVLDDALVLHRLDGRDGRGAGQRVSGVGESAGIDALVEGRADRLVQDDAAQVARSPS